MTNNQTRPLATCRGDLVSRFCSSSTNCVSNAVGHMCFLQRATRPHQDKLQRWAHARIKSLSFSGVSSDQQGPVRTHLRAPGITALKWEPLSGACPERSPATPRPRGNPCHPQHAPGAVHRRENTKRPVMLLCFWACCHNSLNPCGNLTLCINLGWLTRWLLQSTARHSQPHGPHAGTAEQLPKPP